MSQQKTAEGQLGKPAAVAAYLADFTDALLEEGFSDGALRGALLVAATPVVTEYAMKGIFE